MKMNRLFVPGYRVESGRMLALRKRLRAVYLVLRYGPPKIVFPPGITYLPEGLELRGPLELVASILEGYEAVPEVHI